MALYARRKEVLAEVHNKARANFKMLGVDENAAENISLHNSLEEGLRGADIVFENAAENLEIKQNMFVEMEKYTGKDCILASNTSVKPITGIAAKVTDKSRVLGTHWWNPPYLIPLVEVVQTESTDLKMVERCIDLLKRAGKVAVHVKKRRAGICGQSHAARVVERGRLHCGARHLRRRDGRSLREEQLRIPSARAGASGERGPGGTGSDAGDSQRNPGAY